MYFTTRADGTEAPHRNAWQGQCRRLLILESERLHRKLSDGHVQCGSNSLDRAPGWIGEPTLDEGKRAAGHASPVGQGFLADAALVSELADGLAECRLWLLGWSHRWPHVLKYVVLSPASKVLDIYNEVC
jgi:hypothetical protein